MSTPAFTEQSLGKRGSVIITDTVGGVDGTTVTGNFAIIVAGPRGVTNLDAFTCSNKTGTASGLTGALPAGYTSYGNFTSITVKGSGSIEAYNA